MIAAVSGLSTGLVSSPTSRAEPVAPGLCRTGPGPDTGYSHPTFGWAQRPEKSGMTRAGACAKAGSAITDEIAATYRFSLMAFSYRNILTVLRRLRRYNGRVPRCAVTSASKRFAMRVTVA